MVKIICLKFFFQIFFEMKIQNLSFQNKLFLSKPKKRLDNSKVQASNDPLKFKICNFFNGFFFNWVDYWIIADFFVEKSFFYRNRYLWVLVLVELERDFSRTLLILIKYIQTSDLTYSCLNQSWILIKEFLFLIDVRTIHRLILTNTNTTPTLHMKMNMSDIRGKFNYESWFLKEFEIAESSNVISEVNLTMKVGF